MSRHRRATTFDHSLKQNQTQLCAITYRHPNRLTDTSEMKRSHPQSQTNAIRRSQDQTTAQHTHAKTSHTQIQNNEHMREVSETRTNARIHNPRAHILPHARTTDGFPRYRRQGNRTTDTTTHLASVSGIVETSESSSNLAIVIVDPFSTGARMAWGLSQGI